MNIIKYPQISTVDKLIERPVFEAEFLESTVKNIISRVRLGGDEALIKFTEQFDKVKIDSLAVTPEEIAQATARVSDALKQAIQNAKANIEKFHSVQKRDEQKVETQPGVTCWRKSVEANE